MRKFCTSLLTVSLIVAMLNLLPSTYAHAAGVTSSRISGQDRFEVAVNVAKSGWQTSDSVVLANYTAFADALSAAPYAKQLNAPILLTKSDIIPDITFNEITTLKATHIYIVGGTGSVSAQIENMLKSKGYQVTRLGGADRFDVAKTVAAQLPNKQNAIVANGLVFADSLTIAPYAASQGYPILLTRPDRVPQATSDALKGRSQVLVIGGTGSVNSNVYTAVGGDQRIGGADRYEVATNIIKALNLPTTKVFLATGDTFADALTGSVLASKQGAPLLLTRPTSLPPVVKDLVNSKGINNFRILGGPASVSDYVISLVGKNIVLDPGHGGADPGAIAVDGTYEKTLNFEFTNILANKLENYGANIILTRSSDKYVSLENRAQFANDQHPDLFISIHHNVGSGGVYYSTYRPGLDTSGVIVTFDKTYPYDKTYPWVREDTANHKFVYNDNGTLKSASYDCSSCTVAWAFDTTPSNAAKISQDLSAKLSNAMKTSQIGNDGIHNQDLYVTRWTNMPSVLVEVGNIKDSAELKLLENVSIKNTRAVNMAKAVADELK